MAIGGNRQAAIFGVMFASRIGAGDSRVAYGFEFDVIVVVLLGGTSINGGKCTIVGMFLGVMV